MTTKDKTCAELVHEKKVDREVSLEEINDTLNDTESSEEAIQEALEELNNYALEITSHRVLKILMSTGGPADWIEANIDDDGDVISMSYHYQDWFDHAETKITSSSYLWDYAMQFVETIK